MLGSPFGSPYQKNEKKRAPVSLTLRAVILKAVGFPGFLAKTIQKWARSKKDIAMWVQERANSKGGYSWVQTTFCRSLLHKFGRSANMRANMREGLAIPAAYPV